MDRFLDVAWVLPIPPFLAFAVIILFLNRNKTVSALTAIIGVVLSWLIAWPIAFSVISTEGFGHDPVFGELYTIPTGLTNIVIGWEVDPANALMMFMSSFLLVMIFIYSYGYMTFPPHLNPKQYPVSSAQNKDPRYSRFFAYISLFATGMLGLVVADSLLTFFIFWEIMGLCSYLLIGFWYEKPTARAAQIKAFITTRIGDVVLFSGMLLLYAYSVPSSLSFETILRPENLHQLAESVIEMPLLGFEVPAIALISILIFFGTVGKSAQFPLHVWLPDAMEGPTPVSAMIHAATMVSAGVFLLIRMFPLYYVAGEVSPGTLQFVAFIGAFTALFASTIAMAQWDIKRVLAYSTISQLGYMVAAIGIGAYTAALFHLIAHAFFKGLLFLGSGSVIHGVEHGFHHAHSETHEGAHEDEHGDEHGDAHATIERSDGRLDPHDPQDMRNMGGLLKQMPWTGWTFILGGLALVGFPFITAGFWSKDEVLASAHYSGHTWVFITLAVSAFLTAFYTMRQVGMTFFGQPRSVGAEHAPESAWSMVIPLVLITPFAIGLGWLGIAEDFPVFGGIVPNVIAETLEPYMEYLEVHPVHPEFHWVPLTASLVVVFAGLGIGWLIYGRGLRAEQIDPMRKWLGPVWVLFQRKYYVDELYGYTILPFTRGLAKFLYWVDDMWIIDPIVNAIGRASMWLSKASALVDTYVVDGAVGAFAWLSDRSGRALRHTQDGHIQVYLVIAVVSITVWLLLKALPVLLTLV